MARVSIAAPKNDWQAESDLSTLIEAKKIKADPKRMKAACACAKKRKDEMATDMGHVATVADGDKDGN